MIHERFVTLKPWYINFFERMGGNSRRDLFVIKYMAFDLAPRWTHLRDRIIPLHYVAGVGEFYRSDSRLATKTSEADAPLRFRTQQGQRPTEDHGSLAVGNHMNIPTATSIPLGRIRGCFYLPNHTQFRDCHGVNRFMKQYLDQVTHTTTSDAPIRWIVDHPGVWNTLKCGELPHPLVECGMISRIIIYASRRNQKLALVAREGRKIVCLAEGITRKNGTDHSYDYPDWHRGIGDGAALIRVSPGRKMTGAAGVGAHHVKVEYGIVLNKSI